MQALQGRDSWMVRRKFIRQKLILSPDLNKMWNEIVIESIGEYPSLNIIYIYISH